MTGMTAAEHYTTAIHHAESAKQLLRELTRKPREGEIREADWRERNEQQLEWHLRFADLHAQLSVSRATGVQLAQLYSTGRPETIRAEAEQWAVVVTGDPNPRAEHDPHED